MKVAPIQDDSREVFATKDLNLTALQTKRSFETSEYVVIAAYKLR